MKNVAKDKKYGFSNPNNPKIPHIKIRLRAPPPSLKYCHERTVLVFTRELCVSYIWNQYPAAFSHCRATGSQRRQSAMGSKELVSRGSVVVV